MWVRPAPPTHTCINTKGVAPLRRVALEGKRCDRHRATTAKRTISKSLWSDCRPPASQCHALVRPGARDNNCWMVGCSGLGRCGDSVLNSARPDEHQWRTIPYALLPGKA